MALGEGVAAARARTRMTLMTPERWHRIKDLFHAAVDIEPDARAAFLDNACGDDEIRRDVESLIAQDRRTAGLFETAQDAGAWFADDRMQVLRDALGDDGSLDDRLTSGDLLGPYRIVAPLGTGGMGDVYRATDTRLGREVALGILG